MPGLGFADVAPGLTDVLPKSIGVDRAEKVTGAKRLGSGLLVDTLWVPPEDRFLFWQSVSAEVIGPVSVDAPIRHSFNGRLFAHPLGPLMVRRVVSDASSIRCLAKTASTAEFLLILLESGHLRVDGCDTQVYLGPGDLLLCDWSLPYEITSVGDGSFKTLTMSIPRSRVHPHQDQLGRCVGRPISASEGTGRLVSAFLRELSDVLASGGLVADDFRLAQSAVDVTLAMFLAFGRDDETSAIRSRSALSARVKRYIDDHLGDPDLDPESIAQAHFISMRQLYKVFEGDGPSVAEWVRQRRVECCRRDLADRSLAAIPVMKIAARWGFTSPAHFSRTFRSIVGCSPREFRNQMLGRDPGSSQCAVTGKR